MSFCFIFILHFSLIEHFVFRRLEFWLFYLLIIGPELLQSPKEYFLEFFSEFIDLELQLNWDLP